MRCNSACANNMEGVACVPGPNGGVAFCGCLTDADCGAKDSGRTFGEMGGALDLVDALLLAGPAAYLFHRVVLA